MSKFDELVKRCGDPDTTILAVPDSSLGDMSERQAALEEAARECEELAEHNADHRWTCGVLLAAAWNIRHLDELRANVPGDPGDEDEARR